MERESSVTPWDANAPVHSVRYGAVKETLERIPQIIDAVTAAKGGIG